MDYFINEFKNIIEDFKRGWMEFLKYEFITKLILTILIMPIFSFCISFMMKYKGTSVMANNQILKFGLSKQGIISLAMLYIMAIFVILIEIGGIIVIGASLVSDKKYYKFYSVLVYCLKRIPKFIGIGGVYAVLFYIAFINFIGMQDYSIFGISFEVPGFIQSYIDESKLLIFTEIIIGLLIIYLSVRWIFTFHLIVLENKSSREALKESSRIVKENYIKVIKYLLGFFVVNIILIGIGYITWSIIISKCITMFKYSSYFGRVFILSIVLIRKSIGFLVFFILAPFQIHGITRLFFSLKKEDTKKEVFLNLEIKEGESLIDKIFSRKKSILAIMVLIIVFFSISVGFVADDSLILMENTKVTSHRGNIKNAPENTLASIKSAINCKADFAEIDVVQSKDSKIFLSHDFSLKNCSELYENVWDLKYEDIKKLDGGVERNRKPLLNEAIKLAKGNIKLNIEIKANENQKNIVENVVDIIEKENFIGSCVVTSLDYDTIKKVKKLNPRIKTGYIIYIAKGNLQNLNTDFYSIEESVLSEELVSKAHSMGREVHVWTVNNKSNMEKYIELGVDNIITDESEELISLLEHMKNKSPFKRFLQMIINI